MCVCVLPLKFFKSSFFFNSSGGSNRLEDAVECYQRAANLFKMAKNWSQAGKAFCEAANLHSKAGSRHDAATNYVDASNCYKKTEPHEAVNCLKQAIAIYTDMGRFTMAAKHHQTIAEMYENEANDLVCKNATLGAANIEFDLSFIHMFFFFSIHIYSNVLWNTTSKRLNISKAKNQPVQPINVC